MTEWTPERLDDVAAVLLASPHISALSEGAFGTVASYLPGRRIPGLRVRSDGRLEVHVVMAWESTVDDVEATLQKLDEPAEIAQLVIEDIALPASENRALTAGTQKDK